MYKNYILTGITKKIIVQRKSAFLVFFLWKYQYITCTEYKLDGWEDGKRKEEKQGVVTLDNNDVYASALPWRTNFSHII